MLRRLASTVAPWRAPIGALAVLAGAVACAGIITGPDAPDTRPRSMRVAPASITVARGDTARLIASLFDATGAPAAPEPGVPLTYVSSDTSIARVDGTGLVTGIGGGRVTLRGVYGALTLGIPAQVTVRPRIVGVSGAAQSAEQGDTLALPIVVRALDDAGQPLAGVAVDFLVASGGGAVVPASAPTDGAGNAQTRWILGTALGAQSVRAQRAGSDSLTVSATATPGTRVRRVAVTALRSALAMGGDTTQLLARAYNVVDSLLPAATFVWTSADTTVLTVAPTGLVTSRRPGQTYARAASGGFADSALITVQPPAASGVRHWSGAVSDDWTLAGNWLEGSAPVASDSVVIPATGVTNMPRIVPGAHRALVSRNTGTITIDGDGALFIEDALVLPTGTLAASCSGGAGIQLRSPTTDGPHALGGRLACGITLESSGDRILVDSLMLVGGGLGLDGVTRLTLDGHTIDLGDEQLSVRGNARLEMLDPADRVRALFANLIARGQGSMFAAGELHVRQGLAVSPGPSDFVAIGSHRIVMEASAPGDTATLLTAVGVRFRNVELREPTKLDGTFIVDGDVVLTAGAALVDAPSASFGLPQRIRVAGDYTAAAGAPTTVRYLALGGALVAPSFAPETLVFLGTGQRLPLDGTVTGLRTVMIAPSATVTARVTANTRRSIAGDLVVEGDFGMTEAFTAAMGITGSLRVIGTGILRLGGTYSSLRIDGDALFDGRAMTDELATGDIELRGDLVQRATTSSRSLRTAPGFGLTLIGSGAIDFATPDSSYLGTIDHFGNLTRTLRSDVNVQGLVRYDLDNVTVRSDVLGVGGTRTITARGLDFGGSVTVRNVAYRILDGAPLTLDGGPTFTDFDPSAIQLDLVRASGSASLDFANFVTTPTGAGRYLRAIDPTGAGDGAFTVNVSNVTPAVHGGFAQAVAPAVINGWPAGVALLPLQLGNDFVLPTALQAPRTLRFPSALAADARVTVRSLDPARVVVALDSASQGGDSVQVDAVTGDTIIRFHVQGIEAATGDVAILASAPGFAPDTLVVSLTRPSLALLLVTPATVATAGGPDPVLQLTVGYDNGGTLVPMALRAFGPGASFIVGTQDDERARVGFNATANTTGADQPPATNVTFTLRPGRSATALADATLAVPASLVISRVGQAGQVDFTVSAAPEWLQLGANPRLSIVAPRIVLAPDSVAFSAVAGDTIARQRTVAVTNATLGTLGGLAVEVLYGPGASDWLSVSFDSTTAPATMSLSALTPGLAPGTYSASVIVTSTAPSAVQLSLPVSLTVVPAVAGAPDRIERVSGDSSAATVATALAAPIVARVVDANGLPVEGVMVGWSAIYGCCNPFASATDTSDANGLVAFSYTMPIVASVISVQATAVGITGPANFTTFARPAAAVNATVRTGTGGGLAGQAILPGWTVEATDQFGNIDTTFVGAITMTLSNGPTGITTLGGTSTRNAVAGVAVFNDLTVNVANSSWVLLASSPGLATTASAAFSISIPATLSLVNTPLVGVNGTATMRVVLGVPAYGSGLTVALVSSNTGVVVVNAPASVVVPVGQTTADFTVSGVSTGTTFLTATVEGTTAVQTSVSVSTNTISVPLTLNLPYTRTASLPINLPAPAPVGGLTIDVTSGDPSVVTVLTPTVFIPQGGVSGNAQLEGLVLGQATVTATGPNLATGTSSVTVTAALDLLESNVAMNAGFSTVSLTTRLLSGGVVFPAPTGGIPITFLSRNTACVAAPTGASVAVGLNSVTTIADYGGTATLPCTTSLVVSSPSFDVDSVQVTVNPPPTTSFSLTSTVAAGLSRDGILFLGTASPAGGTTITITSSDPTRLVVAPNSATVGAASVDLNIPPGSGYIYFTYAAIEGQLGTAVLSATVNRYQAPTPATITLDPLGVEAGGTTTFTLPGADGSGSVSIGSLGPAGPSQSVSGSTIVRAGGQPVVVTLTSTNPAAVVPVVGGIAASPSTVTINPGQASANYGLRPLAAGTTTITATAPNATAPVRTGYPATLSVTQATTSFSVTPTVAAGLSRDGIIFLGAASPPGGTVIRLTSSDATRLVLAPNSATVGTAFIEVTVPAGSGYSYFTYAALEAAAGTTATITGAVQGAPAAYSDPTPVVITIDPLGVEASGSTSFTMPGADGGGTVYIGSLGPAGPSQSVTGSTMVRAGGQPIVVTLTSMTPATAVPVVGGVAASPATVTINPGQTSASYGLRPLAAGTTSITATAPTATAPVRPGYPATITVAQATTSFSLAPTVAAGLSRDGILFLGAGSPAGGTVITLTSSDPTRLVLAPNSTTVGTATIDVTIPAGSGYSYFTYAAIEGQAGTTATISAVVQGSPAAYANPTPVVITIDTLGIELSGSTTVTTLGSDGGGTVYLGSLGPAGPSQAVSGSTIIRAGGPSIEITLTSTTPTVAVPVVGGIATSPRTITLGPGQSNASYGIRPLVAGTTTISATSPSAVSPVRPAYPATITVNSPSSSISIGPAVGAGLTMDGIVFLQVPAPAGGTTVRLTSSDPSRLLVAPNSTTAGATQVDISVPQGATYTYFTVMGLEDITGNPTVTAQTAGYTDATASVAVLPIGVQWTGTTTMTTLAPDGGGTVYIGILSGVVGNRTITPAQAIRFGGVARSITMTSSNASVALPVVGGVAQQGLSVTVLPGSSSATVGVRPMGAGVATLAPSGAGLVAADAPGYPTTITVTVPNMTLSFTTRSQGAGLSQEGILFLGASVPTGGSRTLTLASNDPTRLLLAPNPTTTGASQISVDLASGTSYAYFTVMGLEGMTGNATVTASIAGYRDSTFTFTLVQPAVTLDGPAATRNVSQGDVSFQAQVGVPSGQSVQAQSVRFGAPSALTVSLLSSAPTIGTLVINGVVNASQTITIPIGASLTSNVVTERATFRPLAPGNVTITAQIPGFVQQGNAIRTVTVSP